MNFLILAGLIIVIALAVYAGWLCYRVWHLGQARRERDRSRQEAVLAGLDVVGRALLQEQMNVTQIYEALGIEQASASHHLNILKTKGVLDSRRSGKNTFYFLKHEALSQMIDCLNRCH